MTLLQSIVVGVYSALGTGLFVYLMTVRMPMEASLHRLKIPKYDMTAADVHLHTSSDVGVI